jgi:signal transduction histidine kinase
VEDVLAAARLDLGASVPGGLPLRKDPIVLTDFVAAVAARFLLLYPSERLDLQVEPGLPALEGDGAMLRRVVDNLIDNARKYSETNSPITLSVRRDGASVCLAVIDHGMGIEPADLPHIFTPFFRADRSRTRKTGGVGMGLTLVRRIVVAHGGSIEVKSEVGVGTQAYVRLPGLIQADPSQGATSAPPRTLPPQTSHTGAA